MSVIADISLEVVVHLNVLRRCLVLIVWHQVCKSPGLCALGLTLVVPLITGYFRLVYLDIVVVR